MKIKTILILSAISLTGCQTYDWSHASAQDYQTAASGLVPQQPQQQVPQTVIINQAQPRTVPYGTMGAAPTHYEKPQITHETTIQPDGFGGYRVIEYPR